MEKHTEKANRDSVQLPLCDKSIITELSGDFTLPDYQPEIKRLLRVTASVLPPSKYVGDNGASLAGNIDYYVLYTGSDNALYCAPLSAEYKVDVPFDLTDDAVDGYLHSATAVANIVPDTISGRVTAPRKISIRSRLRSRVQIMGERLLDSSYAGSDGSLQVLYGNESVVRRSVGVSDTVRVTDEVFCDSRDGDVRVICANGQVLINEAALSGGSVICRGDLYLKLLLCNEGGARPYVNLRKIPLSGNIAIDSAVPGATATVKGSVCDLSITVEEGRLGIDAGVLLEGEVCSKEEISYVKDVYSIARASDNSYKDVTVRVDGVGFSGNFTLSDSLAMSDVGIMPGATVIDVCGVAQTEETEACEGEKCIVSGKVKLSLLTEKDGDYSVVEAEMPFTYRAPASGEAQGSVFSAEVISSKARIDGERVGIDAEIGVSGVIGRCETRKMLSQVAFGDPIDVSKGEFVVCYPANDDSVWSVAKRYGADLSRICSANNLKLKSSADMPETLVGVKCLVI